MTKETQLRFLRIYRILLGIAIVVAGICFGWACLSIYGLGDHPYSREIVASTFTKIAIPVYFCLCLTIGNFLLDFFFPLETDKITGPKDLAHLQSRLQTQKSLSASPSVSEELHLLQRSIRRRSFTCAILFVILSLVFLSYALNFTHYDGTDINGSMIQAMYILTPALMIAFAATIYTGWKNEKDLKSQIELLKQLPNAAADEKPQTPAQKGAPALLPWQIVFLLAGICLVTYGAYSGGIADVLAKAINICTECIGLG